jgi:hypothetical protein
MASTAFPNLLDVDWSQIPAPEDDGGARHLEGARIPDVALPATDGSRVALARLAGRVVVFAYPRTGQPGNPSPVADWDMIPGARGCTPQTCAFRDLLATSPQPAPMPCSGCRRRIRPTRRKPPSACICRSRCCRTSGST